MEAPPDWHSEASSSSTATGGNALAPRTMLPGQGAGEGVTGVKSGATAPGPPAHMYGGTLPRRGCLKYFGLYGVPWSSHIVTGGIIIAWWYSDGTYFRSRFGCGAHWPRRYRLRTLSRAPRLYW